MAASEPGARGRTPGLVALRSRRHFGPARPRARRRGHADTSDPDSRFARNGVLSRLDVVVTGGTELDRTPAPGGRNGRQSVPDSGTRGLRRDRQRPGGRARRRAIRQQPLADSGGSSPRRAPAAGEGSEDHPGAPTHPAAMARRHSGSSVRLPGQAVAYDDPGDLPVGGAGETRTKH
jgi:hypothetical protein